MNEKTYSTNEALANMYRMPGVVIMPKGYFIQYKSASDGRLMERSLSDDVTRIESDWEEVPLDETIMVTDVNLKWLFVRESDYPKPAAKPEPPKEPRNAAWVALQDAIDAADGDFSPKTLRRLFALFGKYIDARMARHYVRSDDGFGAMEKKLAEQQDQIKTLSFRIGKLEPEELDDFSGCDEDDRDEY